MAGWTLRCLVPAAATALVLSASAIARDDSALSRLDRTLRLTPAERAIVENGDPVVRVLEPSAPHEVALAGVIRVDVPAHAFVGLAADLPRWKNGSAVMQIGKFSAEPSVAEVASLHLDEPDLAALRRCAGRPCDVKLAALAPEPFQRFDWQAPDARQRAEALVRSGVVEHARRYLAEGDRSLMVYPQRRTALASEMRDLLREASSVDEHAPGLWACLEAFPRRTFPGARSAIYWARESFGLKPILSLYHVVAVPAPRPGTAVLVSKQFYASRYFDASLDAIVAIDGPAATGRHCYVAQVARSRTDSLRGMMGGFKRSAVTREAEQSLAKVLARFARLAEAAQHGAAAVPEDADAWPHTPQASGSYQSSWGAQAPHARQAVHRH
jgi:hypothetical protein